MKDPVGLLVAVLFLAMGSSGLLMPQWFYRETSPEQIVRDRKRVRIMGAILLPLGLILLALHF